jgi:hypothetical protein
MPEYIVCQKKRNNPRMDVRICEHRCPEKGECKEYIAQHRVAEAPPMELEAA